MLAQSLQLCPTLVTPMDCSPPGSSVHGILRQEYWSGLPCPPPGDLPDPGMEPHLLHLKANSLPVSRWGSPHSYSSTSNFHFVTWPLKPQGHSDLHLQFIYLGRTKLVRVERRDHKKKQSCLMKHSCLREYLSVEAGLGGKKTPILLECILIQWYQERVHLAFSVF